MSDFLSQEEVDALLKGVTGEADEAPAEAIAEGGVRSYDLGRQERIVRDWPRPPSAMEGV